METIFLSVIEEHIAGDPMNENIRWVKLTRAEISDLMKKEGVLVSRNIVRKLLKKHKLVKRKIQRNRACGKDADRNQQFEIIAEKKARYLSSDNPVISVDTKKKEMLGNLHRSGETFCTQALETYDHDYAHLSSGKIAPHGIYDVGTNLGHITINASHETADFVCDSIQLWWNNTGIKAYPDATEILILCDAGGANSYRHHLFKVSLQNLANTLNKTLVISHYPPYTSKWNPIEHRLFPHVTRALAGVPLLSEVEAQERIKKTKTTTGLKVSCDIIKKTYETGKRATKAMVEKLNIEFDELLGKFNYSIAPEVT